MSLLAQLCLTSEGAAKKKKKCKYPPVSVFPIATIFIQFSLSQQPVLPRTLLWVSVNGESLPANI